MCVSLLVENDPSRIAAAVGLAQAACAGEAAADALQPRVEARGAARILRLGAGGRVVSEAMTFNPYVIRRMNVAGDIWSHTLLGESHGILVLKAFSEWTSTERLLRGGMLNIFEVNCAFNRFAAGASQGYLTQPAHDRLVLGNFRPTSGRALLVPVLFDQSRRTGGTLPREFALISQEPPAPVARTGAVLVPVTLTLEAALAWLHAVEMRDPAETSAAGELDTDLDEVLEDGRDEAFQFSLFKAA